MNATQVREVLKMARVLVELRWESYGNGAWVDGDPTGWRRRFDVSSALVYAGYFLRIDDSVVAFARGRLEDITKHQRPIDPQTKERKPLHWWNAQQKDVTPVLALIDEALADGVWT